MSIRTNSKLAGVTFLLYIVAGITGMMLSAAHPADKLITLVTSLCALLLGVTLYAITRSVDADLALLALACRIVESVPGGDGTMYFAVGSTIFAWLFLRGRLVPAALAWLGVVASALLVVILPLQRLGALPSAGWTAGATWILWLPALIFEIALSVWLLTKGVAPAAAASART